MNRGDIERQLRWLMILRVVTVTTLLISAFAIELIQKPGSTLRPLFILAAVAYGTVLLYAIMDRWLGGRAIFACLQLVGDAAVVTAFVDITGGVDSPMSFLYLLPIGCGSAMLYRRGGLLVAGVSLVFYGSLVIGGTPWLPLGRLAGIVSSAREPWRVSYTLLAHGTAFVAVALLASYLSERVREQGDELAERSGAVARLQALNENVIASIHSGLITTDLGGRIHFMNRGGAEITGCPAGNLEGRSILEVLGLESGFLRDARSLLAAKRRFRFEKDFRTSDGRTIFLGIAMSILQDRSGAPLGYIFIFQDLTEIQALEREVRLKERMAALGEMAAGLAHELRNPLASISGAVQYLRGSLRPEGETLELMDILLRESQRLDQAIRDFLTFARPGVFAPERCDVVRLLEDSVKLLRKSREFREAHRVAIRHDAAEIWCTIDPNRMKQVFWNLATNALKAMPRGGTLTIEVAERAGVGTVAIAFEDDGVGMDADELAHYFQPFRSAFHEGTGLGTAIVYRLVEEHGGRIAVRSTPGKGTRVDIALSRDGRHGVEPTTAPAAAGLSGGVSA